MNSLITYNGVATDTTRAVGIDASIVTNADGLLDGTDWSQTHDRFQRVFNQPVFECMSHEGHIGRYDTAIGAVEALTFDHPDTEAVRTGDDRCDDIIINIDPVYGEPESDGSLLVYELESRARDLVDVLPVVALDNGLISLPTTLTPLTANYSKAKRSQRRIGDPVKQKHKPHETVAEIVTDGGAPRAHTLARRLSVEPD